MQFKFAYRHKKETKICLFDKIEGKKVKDYKEDLSKQINVKPEYIQFKYNGEIIENEFSLSDRRDDDGVINVFLEVVVHEFLENSDEISHVFLMECDDSMEALRKEYCNIVKVNNVLIINGDSGGSLRELLDGENSKFDAFAAVKVQIINENGKSSEVIAFENDTVKKVREILKIKESIMMIGESIMTETRRLYKCQKRDEIVFCVGFHVFLNKGEYRVGDCVINCNTKISYLIENFKDEFNIKHLSWDGKYLECDKTILFYGINDGAILQIIENDETMTNIDTVPNVVVMSNNNDDCKSSNQISVIEHTNSSIGIYNSSSANENHASEHTSCKQINQHEEFGAYGKYEDAVSGKEQVMIIVNNAKESKDYFIAVNKHCDVSELYREVSTQIKKVPCSFDLSFDDQILKHDSKSYYSLNFDDKFILIPKQHPVNVNEQFRITVKNINGDNEHRYLVDHTETVGALKIIIREQYNVNFSCVTLHYNGKELDNDLVIREMDIENGSTFTLLIDESSVSDSKEIHVKVINRFFDNADCVSRDITVCTNDTIESLGQKINSLFDLTAENYVISYRGEILSAQNIVSTYNIDQDCDEIIISPSLLVRLMAGEDYTFAKIQRYAFVASDKVADLFAKIARKNNIKADFIRLSFNGEFLGKNDTLKDAGIDNGSCLMMVATLAGGGGDSITLSKYCVTYRSSYLSVIG